MKNLFLLFLLTSCAVFQNDRISNNVKNEIQKICLNADGNGRLMVQGHKYVFGYETLLDREENKWVMSLNFPLHGQELIELHLDENNEFKQKLEEKILSEKRGVDPQVLHKFMKYWTLLLQEIIEIKDSKQRSKQEIFKWSVNKNKLFAKISKSSNLTMAKFYNFYNHSFARMDFNLISGDNHSTEIKIELIVSKCLDKVD